MRFTGGARRIGTALVIVASIAACTSAETTVSEPMTHRSVAPTTGSSTATPRPQSSYPSGAESVEPRPRSVTPEATGPTSTQRGGVKLVEWILALGVAGGADMAEETAVALLASGECSEAREVARDPDIPLPPVYDAAAAACLAALEGRTALWSFAESVAARPVPMRDCLDRAVVSLLRRLVEIHREDPAAQLRPKPAEAGETLPCPRIVRLIPDHGPPEGGYPLHVVGVHLPPEVVIHFVQYVDFEPVDTSVTARSMDGTEAVITVPPRLPRAERTVTVIPDGWPMGPIGATEFQYEPFQELGTSISPAPARTGGSADVNGEASTPPAEQASPSAATGADPTETARP